MLKTDILILKDDDYRKEATIYRDDAAAPKGALLYFHGGGLLYGDREDLPGYHIYELTQAGYVIVAFDYPLAPGMMLEGIFRDAVDSVNDFCQHKDKYFCDGLPYFLFGRSAGSYLALLVTAKGILSSPPAGILSYYGYGFLCDVWYASPNTYYNSFPKISEKDLPASDGNISTRGPLETHYNVYVYARQTGKWKDMIYKGRDKDFFLDYSLRVDAHINCPVLCAHSIGDPDVPYEEFLKLCSQYRSTRFISTQKIHDFDRLEDHPDTTRLLKNTIEFLNKNTAGC